MNNLLNRNNLIVLVIALILLAKAGVIDVPAIPGTAKIDRVTYVYEKDRSVTPPGVTAALRELNEAGMIATPFEADTTSGTNEIPAQDRIAVEAAKAAGLPCLVVQAGEKVVRVVNVSTHDQVIEAAK